MTNINVPDIVSISQMSRVVADIKARADVTRTEVVTGRYADITAATNGDVGSAHLLQKAISDVQDYQSNLSLGNNRATRTQTVLSQLSGESNRIATEALAAYGRSDDTQLQTNALDATTTIFTIFASLNTTDGGRSLFGGDVTDRAPLAAPEEFLADIKAIMASATDAADAEAQLDTYFNDPAGGFNQSIYRGGENKSSSIEIAPGIRLDVSAKADAQPIKDLLRGLAEIATFQDANFAGAEDLASTGANRALSADTSLTELRAAIGVGESRIANAIERYADEEAVLTTLFNEKTARDPFEATSELQQLEAQLEASYLLTSRLSRLTIADYLR